MGRSSVISKRFRGRFATLDDCVSYIPKLCLIPCTSLFLLSLNTQALFPLSLASKLWEHCIHTGHTTTQKTASYFSLSLFLLDRVILFFLLVFLFFSPLYLLLAVTGGGAGIGRSYAKSGYVDLRSHTPL